MTSAKIGLSISALKALPSHKNLILPKTQTDYYVENGAHPDIVKYVGLSPKAFGEKEMEIKAKEVFKLAKRSGSGHDHMKHNLTIEQKSARYYADGSDFKWQHIELKHQWDLLLLTGLEFQGINFYIATREVVKRLIEERIITGQGKNDSNGVADPQQGYWFSRDVFTKRGLSFENYFTFISNEEELVNYIKTATEI